MYLDSCNGELRRRPAEKSRPVILLEEVDETGLSPPRMRSLRERWGWRDGLAALGSEGACRLPVHHDELCNAARARKLRVESRLTLGQTMSNSLIDCVASRLRIASQDSNSVSGVTNTAPRLKRYFAVSSSNKLLARFTPETAPEEAPQ